MSDPIVEKPKPSIDSQDFHRVQQSADFAALKRRFRTFAFPMTAVFLGWYFFYVLGSIFAKETMMRPIAGNLTVGLLLGLGQFASTFIITGLYVWHANKRVDPLARKLREELEEGHG